MENSEPEESDDEAYSVSHVEREYYNRIMGHVEEGLEKEIQLLEDQKEVRALIRSMDGIVAYYCYENSTEKVYQYAIGLRYYP